MAKRGGYPGMGGMNMNNMMKQVQKMQKQMEEAQKTLEEAVYSASAGGAVEVTINGKKNVTNVKLDPDAVDPDDVEMLEDLIMAAVNEAMKKADDASNAAMSKMTGGMGGFSL